MEAPQVDTTWALVTLLVTALLGFAIMLVLMIVLESRAVSKPKKRVATAVAFIFYIAWLVTLGDPRSSISFEKLCYWSMGALPEKYRPHRRAHPAPASAATNAAPGGTNSAVPTRK